MWLSKIKKKKVQMFLIGLIVFVSSLMLSAALGVIISVDKPMKELIKQTNAPILFMGISAVNDIDKEALESKETFQKDANVASVNIISNVINSNGKFMNGDKEIKAAVKYFLTYKDNDFGTPRFLKGGGYLDKGECFISSNIAEVYKVSVDDYITIEYPSENIKLKVKGIYSDPYSISMGIDVYRYYVSEEQLKYITGAREKLITVYGEEGADPKDIVKNYKKNINKQISNIIIDLDMAKVSTEISQQITGAFIAAFALIILLVSIVVIRASILDSIAKEYKSIGVYKSLGYTHFTIMSIYMKAYSIVVLFGALFGVFLSKNITGLILAKSFRVYGVNVRVSQMLPMAATVIFVVSLMLTSIYRVVKKTKVISPVEALRLGMPVNNKKGNSLKFMRNSFSPISQAFRKILCYKKFSMILFLVLFICSYVVAFSVTNYNNTSILSEKSNFWFGLDNAQYRINIMDKEKENEVYEWVKNNQQVKNYVKGTLNYFGAAVSKEEIDSDGSIVLEVYEQYDTDIDEEVIEGRNPKSEDEIAMCRKVLEKTHKTIGDYIDVYIKNEKKSLLITGSYQSMIHIGMNARVLEKTVKSVDANYSSTNISLNLNDSKEYDSFKKKAIDKFGKSIDISESKDFLKDTLDSVMEPPKVALTPFMIMVIIIGAINVFSIIALMNLNNRRGFCIYKSIGYSTIDLIISNGIYVLILGILASIICMPVFSITFPIIMNLIFKMFGIYNYPANIKPGLLILSLFVSIAIYILSTVISSLSISKFKVQELNEE